MINNPLVSIIIPTFDRKKSLLKTINNVLEQKWKKIEIIIIDDGISVNLEPIIHSLKNKKIIYKKTTKKIGCALSRAQGVNLSKGDFIAFLDDDDEWHEKYLINQLEVFKENKAIDFVICNYKINYFNKFYEIKNMQPYALNFQNKILESPGPFFQCCVFKKKILENINNLVDTNCIPSEDWDFFINLSTENPRVGFSNQIGFTWNFSKNSQSFNFANEARGITNLIKKHKKIIIKSGVKIMLSNHYRRIARIYEKLKDYKQIKLFYKKSFLTAPYYWKNILYILISSFGESFNFDVINKIRKHIK